MNNDKIDNPNEVDITDKISEIPEEKICSICGITEEETITKSLNLTKLSDMINKKYNKELSFELLSIMPKNMEIYVCDKCVELTNKIVENMLSHINEKSELNKNLDEMRDDIESFEDYISSTAHLFKLDHVTVIQVCFNTVMAGIRMISERDPELSKTLIKTSIIELERELQKLKQ